LDFVLFYRIILLLLLIIISIIITIIIGRDNSGRWLGVGRPRFNSRQERDFLSATILRQALGTI